MQLKLLGIAAVIVYVLVVSAIFALPTMLLWNWLMPEIFSLPQIGFLQTLGLLILSSLLFGSYSSVNN